jgi:mannose-6-phosphate isomerase-like protein (cupin superfamily)
MSSVIVEADRIGGPLGVLFGEQDGATRIWMMHMAPPREFHIGLHHHGGDEIWRVRKGRLRIMVDGRQTECRAGELVVVPPNVEHGVMALEEGTEAEVIGEIAMGEWVKVIDPDGSSRQVEVHVPMMPWHRRPPAGSSPTSMEDMVAMLETTAHLL